MNTQKYLETLFNEGEHVCLATDIEDTVVRDRDDWIIKPEHKWVSINPYKKYSRRNKHNVVAYRNFVVECDDIDTKTQADLVSSLNMPYSACTHSGNKSLHYVIALEAGYETEAEWREACSWLFNIFKEADAALKYPSAFTRLPGGVRDGKLQQLKEVRGRISKAHFENWLNQFQNAKPKPRSAPRRAQPGAKLSYSTRQLVAAGYNKLVTKGRHMAVKRALIDMYRKGVGFDSAVHSFERFLTLNPDKSENEIVSLAEWVWSNYELRR